MDEIIMPNKINHSRVLEELPPYLFSRIDQMVAKKRGKGMDVISFGVGDPDLPTPKNILDALVDSTKKPENYQYPTYEGKPEFRQAVAGFYKRRWGLELEPGSEIIATLGAKEAIHNASFAFGHGTALVPDPAYTVYFSSARFAGRKAVQFPLTKTNGFKPDMDFLLKHAKGAVYLWLNYPNNPTAATMDKEELGEVVDFCRRHNIVLLYDNTYSETAFDGFKPPSPLEFGLDGIVEFQSLSKTYSMTGFRLGWVAGDAKLVHLILSVKKNIDSGVAGVIQDAGIEALNGPREKPNEYVGMYKKRRDLLFSGLEKLGLKSSLPKATFYIWAGVPDDFKGKPSPSMAFTEHLLDKTGIVVTPGMGFGKHGEGFVRFALTQPLDRIKEALERIEKI
jgi:LL-diaminopimelate aminotransferase